MVSVRTEKLPAFTVAGRKTWISGQDNAQFAAFWAESEQNGLLKRLDALQKPLAERQTKCRFLGISRVENDPNNRAFDFYIAVECDETPDDLEAFAVPAGEWAVFTNVGQLPLSLVESEIYAMTVWLPASPYRHALAPEMEGYPPVISPEGTVTEFWLPLSPR